MGFPFAAVTTLARSSRIPSSKCENRRVSCVEKCVRKTWERRGRFVEEFGPTTPHGKTRWLFRTRARKSTGHHRRKNTTGLRFRNFSTNSQHSSQQQDASFLEMNFVDSCSCESLRPVNCDCSVLSKIPCALKFLCTRYFPQCFSPPVPFILC